MNNDLISREALKQGIEHIKETGYDTNNEPLFDFVELSTLFKLIDNAPTVQPERPKGEWIKEDNGKTTDLYRCSICGRSIMLCKNADLSKYPFCHCGAEMKGSAE